MSQTRKNKKDKLINLKYRIPFLKLITGIGILMLISGSLIYLKTSNKSEDSIAQLEEVSQTEEQNIEEIARSITVKVVSGSGGGSGVIIRKEGQVYTVLTNNHVLKKNESHKVITPDGKSYEAKVKPIDFQEKDLALLEFQSSANYQVASLANLSNANTGNQVFSSGFPFVDQTSEQRDFAFKLGRISLVLPQAFKGGYQLGYINDVQKGMSGGPVLNKEGKVVAINGIHSHPLWGNPYIYENGTSPSDVLRQRLERSSWGIPIEQLTQYAPETVPQLSIAKSPATEVSTTELAEKINQIADNVSVKIQWQTSNGSGVIIAKEGNTYTVLTAEHVASHKSEKNPNGENRSFTLITPDGKKHKIDNQTIKTWDYVDLALMEFTSDENYQIAKLGDYNLESQDRVAFVTGWPSGYRSNDRRGRRFSVGFVLAGGSSGQNTLNANSLSQGKELIYTNITERGMSGGPVFDTKGHLIGIHAAAEAVEGDKPNPILEKARDERKLNLGYSLGVPLRTFLTLIKKEDEKLNLQKEDKKLNLQIETSLPLKLSPAQQDKIVTYDLAEDKKLNLQIETSLPPKLSPAQQDKIVSESLALEIPSDNADEVDWLNYGNKLWRSLRFQEAQQAFEKAIDIDPTFYEAWYAHGLALKNQGEFNKAVSSFEKVIEFDSKLNNINDSPKKRNSRLYRFALYAYRQQALCFDALLEPQKSLAALNQAIKKDENDFTLYYHQALIFAALGQYGEALNAIDQSIESSEGKNPYPYLRKAEVMIALLIFDTPRIVENYTKAIQIQPSLATAYALRGVTTSSNYASAIKDINEAIEINPENAVFHAQKGVIFAKVGNRKQFEKSFEQAIKLEPDNPIIYSLRGQAFAQLLVALKNKQKNISEDELQQSSQETETTFSEDELQQSIIDNYIEAIRLHPENAGSYYLSLSANIGLAGNIEKSLSFYDEAQEYLSNKELGSLLASEGHNLYLSGDEEKARLTFAKARELEPNNVSIDLWEYLSYYNKMNEYYENGEREKGDLELEKAIALADKSIKKYPKVAFRFHEQNALTYFTREFTKPENAKKDYSLEIESRTKAIENTKGKDAHLYYDRAGAYRLQGNYELALADINKAIELESQANPTYYNFRGNIYDDQKQYNQAIENYTKAIAIDPDNPQFYKSRFHTRYKLGEYDKKFGALQNFLNQVELNEEDAPLFLDLNRSKILKAINNTILYPENPEYDNQLAEGYKLLANAYAKYSKDYQTAFESLKPLEAIDPNHPVLIESYQLIGNTAILNQDWQQGIIAYEKIAEIDPSAA
ncbi:MAG: trypsin-like peptidase domain-containing protein [Crocosphaera sp.]|uniref:serine protease n=1 Tax=Crocosphaera sp. TaxID=2729996 RepID=UPI002584DFBD|nr:serine protease [Crocosphaera sp.]MCH2247810.1 trypsin-like peptidase domain-containing protein [Crocosphaera sp.]